MRLSTLIGILLLTVIGIGGVWVHLVSTGSFSAEPVIEILSDSGTNGTLTVATDIDYWPYSFIDKEGRVSGREVELVHAVAKRLGMKVEIKPMQWAECLKLAGTHTVDLVLTCAEYATDCDTDDLLYSIPDGSDTYTVFGKKPLESLSELGNRRLAQLKFGNVNPTLEAAGFGPSMKLYSSHREAFEAIRRDEADYVVIRYTPAVGLLKEMGIKDIKPQCSAGISCFCIGVNRQKPELLRKINDELMVLRVNGTSRRLTEKWLTTYVEPDTLSEIATKHPQMVLVFLVIGALFVGVLFWVAHERTRTAARLRTNLDVVEELVACYTEIAYVDLETGRYEDYVISDYIAEVQSERKGHPLYADQMHAFFESESVHPDSRAVLHAFYPHNQAWREALANQKKIGVVFRRKRGDGYRWTRMDVIRRGAVPRKVVVAFSDCDAEYREQNEHRVHEQILEELTKSYFGYNLTVNLENLSVSLVRGTGCDKACDYLETCVTYDQADTAFMNRIADDVHRRKARELMSINALRDLVKQGRRGFIGSVEYPVTASDGEAALCEWRETNVFLNVNADGEAIVNIVCRNITKQKLQIETEKKLEVAESARKAQSEFLFNMSHDVRTPVHAIMGFVDIIMQNLSDGTRACLDRLQAAREGVENIRRSGDLLFSLLNSVLDVSRLESGHLKLSESPADVMRSFDGVKTAMGLLAKEKGIELAFAFGEIRDRYVYADIEKADRVFLNMLTNAIKYTNAGGRVKATCEQVADGRYRYTFEDTGIGIEPEFLERIYDRFSREQNTTKSGVSGLGLGLAISKAFVDLMGGTITCQSQKGVGTVFAVTLTFRRQQGTQKYFDPSVGRVIDVAAPKAETKPLGEKPFVGQKALLVDDSKLNLTVSRHYLVAMGLEVETATDGSQAVELVRKNGPGYYFVIMMDVQMPVMDGYEAARQIRAWEKGQNLAAKGLKPVPIIAWSANAFDEDREKSLATGMNDHLVKGAKPAQIRDAIARWG